MLRDDLDAYRHRGLVVDEDFELGISPAGRAGRATFIAFLVFLIGALAVFAVIAASPGRTAASNERPHKSHVRPASVRPLGTAPPTPIRRGRANV